MLNFILCDDDTNHLQTALEALEPLSADDERRVALVTADAQDVLRYAKGASEDDNLYFLDICLDDAEPPAGLRLCQQVLALDPRAYVVFVSAYPQYALSCCQNHAFDFLVKPFTRAQLASCVKAVVLDMLRRREGLPLPVTIGSRLVRLDQYEIYYFSRSRDYVCAHTVTGELFWRESYASLEPKLEGSMFVRVHHSYLVNIQHALEFDESSDQLLMSDGTRVPCSRRLRQSVLKALAGCLRKQAHE